MFIIRWWYKSFNGSICVQFIAVLYSHVSWESCCVRYFYLFVLKKGNFSLEYFLNSCCSEFQPLSCSSKIIYNNIFNILRVPVVHYDECKEWKDYFSAVFYPNNAMIYVCVWNVSINAWNNFCKLYKIIYDGYLEF